MTKIETNDTEEKEKEHDYAQYDAEDFSELMLRALTRSAVVLEAAIVRKMKPDDFVSGVKGIRIYKDIAAILLTLKQSPCDREIFDMNLKLAAEKGKFNNYDDDVVAELIAYLFDPAAVIQEDYILEHLPLFIRRRRMLKVSQKHKDDLEAQHTEFAKIHDAFQAAEVRQYERSLIPFERPIKIVEQTAGMPTGIAALDLKTGGLRTGECGMLLGASGSGKTAVGSFFARHSALNGFNVLYISAEEAAENICNRWYSQQFKIDYNRLYRGDASFELDDAFNNCDVETRKKLMRLRISDVRSLAPLNTRALKDVVERYADEGFVADLVMIDQLDYLRPVKSMTKGAQKWEEYAAVSFELDLFSQHRIGGTQEFGLWVLHQASGAPQWHFTFDSIASFKGVVKPFDLVVGVGREVGEDHHINLFSLKTRHSGHFNAPQKASFEYMTFEDDATYKPKAERDKETARQARVKGKAAKRATPVEAAQED